jgi:hypothetical protein
LYPQTIPVRRSRAQRQQGYLALGVGYWVFGKCLFCFPTPNTQRQTPNTLFLFLRGSGTMFSSVVCLYFFFLTPRIHLFFTFPFYPKPRSIMNAPGFVVPGTGVLRPMCQRRPSLPQTGFRGWNQVSKVRCYIYNSNPDCGLISSTATTLSRSRTKRRNGNVRMYERTKARNYGNQCLEDGRVDHVAGRKQRHCHRR